MTGSTKDEGSPKTLWPLFVFVGFRVHSSSSYSLIQGRPMPTCDVCGNEYDKAFTVTMDDHQHTFDSFECAIHALAPICAHCGCKVIGHGVEEHGTFYCCNHCAQHAGVAGH
jgi:hypothetical protein